MKMKFVLIFLLFLTCTCAFGQDNYYSGSLDEAFTNAQKVDLSKCNVESVVKLRDKIGIPPPTELVLVKKFSRNSLPEVLQQFFSDPNVGAVTIAKKYVAVLDTNFDNEYEDRLNHELVHAYISLASPKDLPFWFQEGSAVYFSTGSFIKAYAQSSDKHIGQTEGKVTSLNDDYRNGLHNMQYLHDTSGEAKFDAWYRNAVLTGDVSVSGKTIQPQKSFHFPKWGWVVAILVLIGVGAAGYFALKFQEAHSDQL